MLPEGTGECVIIAGYGRVGRLVASMLEEHKVPWLAVDADADLAALKASMNKEG